MYCINCGVKLADSEKACPLCGTVPYHPQISRPEGEPLYPAGRKPKHQVRSRAAQIVATALFLLPILVTLQVDLLVDRTVSWSGYVAGALMLAYVVMVVPTWFRRPNPVILLPCDVLGVVLYLFGFMADNIYRDTMKWNVIVDKRLQRLELERAEKT